MKVSAFHAEDLILMCVTFLRFLVFKHCVLRLGSVGLGLWLILVLLSVLDLLFRQTWW